MRISIRTLTCTLIMSAGCKTPASSSQVAGTDNAQPGLKKKIAVAVVSGGFDSCPDDGLLDKPMRAGKTAEMVSLFRTAGPAQALTAAYGTPPPVLATCYTGPESLKKSLAQSIEMRVAWNATELIPGRGGVRQIGVPQGDALRSTNFLTEARRQLQELIRDKKSAGVDVDLYLFGHSYGGFTAIHLADSYAENVKGIYTIDPISVLACQAKAMATRPDKTLTLNHPGCKTAPSDTFSAEAISRIQARQKNDNTIVWYNSYQTIFPFLHSGAIPAQPGSSLENESFPRDAFKNSLQDGDYHSQMGRRETVWDKILDRMRRQLGQK